MFIQVQFKREFGDPPIFVQQNFYAISNRLADFKEYVAMLILSGKILFFTFVKTY